MFRLVGALRPRKSNKKGGRHPTITAKRTRSNERREGQGTHDLLSLTDGGFNDIPKSHKNFIFICSFGELNGSSNSHNDDYCGQEEHDSETNFLPGSESASVKHVEGEAYY